MNLDSYKKLREDFGKRPVYVTLALVVLLLITLSGMWTGGYLGEKGRRAAVPVPEDRESATTLPAPAQQAQISTGTEAPQKHIVDSAVTPSYDQYLDTLDKLRGRYLETDEYLKSLKDKSVIWTGYVSRVSEASEELVMLTIAPNREKGVSLNCIALFFDPSLRSKLYALREGDKVQVTGTFREGPLPVLNGVDVRFLESALTP